MADVFKNVSKSHFEKKYFQKLRYSLLFDKMSHHITKRYNFFLVYKETGHYSWEPHEEAKTF